MKGQTMLKNLVRIVGFLATVSTPYAFAHPGHGVSSVSAFWHHLAEPTHVATLVAAGLVAVFVVKMLRRDSRN
jgi:hydrogenase/urease accessory protein HupE